MATPPLPLLPFGHPLPVRRGAERIIFSPPHVLGRKGYYVFRLSRRSSRSWVLNSSEPSTVKFVFTSRGVPSRSGMTRDTGVSPRYLSKTTLSLEKTVGEASLGILILSSLTAVSGTFFSTGIGSVSGRA